MVVAKQRMSLFLVFALLASLLCALVGVRTSHADSTITTDQFTDLSNLSSSDKDKFNFLFQKGVFSGVSDTSFGVDQKMNRAQFAKVAAIIFGLKVDSSLSSSSFVDVTSDDPSNGYALPYIEAIKAAGITSGVDDTHYDPAGTVSREQLAAFLIKGLKLEDKAKDATPADDSTVDSWAKGYVAVALQNKLMDKDGDSFGGTSPATRYMLALAAYAELNYNASSSDSGSTSTTSDSGAAITPDGKSIAVVGRTRQNCTKNAEDSSIINEMQKLGFRTTCVDEATATVDKLNQFDIVYFSPTLNEKFVKDGQMKGLTIPQIYGKFRGLQGLQLADQPTGDADGDQNQSFADGGGSRSMNFTGDAIKFDGSSNPIANGLSDGAEIYKDVSDDVTKKQIYADSRSIDQLAKSAEIFATPSNSTTSASVIAFEKGAKAEDGSKTGARIIFLLQALGFPDQITSDGYKLMDNAVLWALQN